MTVLDAGSHAVHMSLLRSRNRRTDHRLAVVDAYQFPTSVRQRFILHHSGLADDDVKKVEAATRQWFRLYVRHPKAKLSMPSVAVDELWHELVLHTREYAAFCDAAFGRFLHHVPESAMRPAAAAANRFTDLEATFRLAQRDEGCEPKRLPLLFRVDQELPLNGGRRYLADCGGRGECYERRGTLCLQHINGMGNPTRGDWNVNRASYGGMPGPCGFGDGCGGGGCGN